MRFTIIGHAALFAETTGPTILVDPWLSGSAGWRSWWQYPPSAELRPGWLTPDFLYLTHHHPDHFHYPSMRRIDRDTQILIPRFGVRRMEEELRNLGFTHVREIDHGEIVHLAPTVRVASYQYGFDDTLFAIADGDHVLIDANDCKIRGRAMGQVRRDFGRPTFLLKSHSFAQAYPVCYEAEDPADLELIDRDTYLDDAVGAIRELEPDFAVPFGSMVAFLHPESLHVNRHLVGPGEVVEAVERLGGTSRTRVVPMSPGDQWDSQEGFERSSHDWYADRERHLEELALQVRPRVDRQKALEAERTLPFGAFATYFRRFQGSLPWIVRRALLPRPIVFRIGVSSEPCWLLDFRRRRVERCSHPPEDCASVIEVSEGLLADAIAKEIVHFVHGSMRLRVRLGAGGAQQDLAFWGLLAIWEIGYLPLRRVLGRRFLGIAWRRRREALDLVRALVASGSPLERLSSRFATPHRKA
jgi:UDP-MurNAc hydroxylase